MSLCWGIISAVCFYYGYYILGAINYLLRYLGDWVDGKTARATSNTSKYGAFLDNYLGTLTTIVIILGYFKGNLQGTILLGAILLRNIGSMLYHKHNTVQKHTLTQSRMDWFSTGDVKHVVFFLVPLFVWSYRVEIVWLMICLMLVKELAVFVYYSVRFGSKGWQH